MACAADGDGSGIEPLRPDEAVLVAELTAALAEQGGAESALASIQQQLASLRHFAELLAMYPSPLAEQVLDGRRRDLSTLVEALTATDVAAFPFRAPTQALVGRAMNMAQINFLRMVWILSGAVVAPALAAELRERAAVRLRAAVHTRLVEEVLVDLVTDATLEHRLRAQAVRNLAQLWGQRLTWRVSEFFPILAATWEARQRVRIIGGTLLGTCEILQLLTAGGEPEFVDLLLDQDYGEVEVQAFREFLFGRSSEELERLAQRMANEQLSSIEIDSKVGASGRDAGSLLYEFFRSRFVLCGARRVAGLPGPRHTAEGYVMLAWLLQQCQRDKAG
jgi:hypothetical protein